MPAEASVLDRYGSQASLDNAERVVGGSLTHQVEPPTGRVPSKRTRIRFGLAAVGVAAALCLSFVDLPNALNDYTIDTEMANSVAADVASAQGVVDVIPISRATHDAENAVVVSTSAGTVSAPREPSAGVTLVSTDGTRLGIGIPDGETAHEARATTSGTVVYNDPSSSSAMAVQATADGVRQLFVLQNPSAPTVFAVPLVLPEGASLIRDSESGYEIATPNLDGTASAKAKISAPWARDARGVALPTNYTVDGTTLTQHIDTSGAVFPIVADPHYTWGIISGTVYFNKSETKLIALGGTVASWFPNPGAIVGGRAIGGWAAYAVATNQCVKFKMYAIGAPTIPGSAEPGYYRGGYCR